MLKECSKMSEFDHPNVLTLRGVCLDGGPAPYIIMPFMANGNLLTYLKNNRKTLVIASGSEDEEVSSRIILNFIRFTDSAALILTVGYNTSCIQVLVSSPDPPCSAQEERGRVWNITRAEVSRRNVAHK